MGLGNLLLVWARAAVFAKQNQLSLVRTGWEVRIGPWLRRERNKRIYISSFRHTSLVERAHAAALRSIGEIVDEPDVAPLGDRLSPCGTLYRYRALPNYLADVVEHRDYLREQLYGLLSLRRRAELDRQAPPIIGVHVRCGDFGTSRELATDLGRTPLDYFRRIIEGIRRVSGSCLSATVFSDGTDDELAELLDMPDVKRAPSNADIVDMLLLARSNVVVPAAWSTFSLWSGFLSDAPVILYPIDRIPRFRTGALAQRMFAGSVPEDVAQWPSLLIQNLRAIPSTQNHDH